MTHPIITLEDFLVRYIKQQIANVALWLLEHLPQRAKFQALMFSAPSAEAKAQIITYNGWTVGTVFYGSAISQAAVLAPPKVETPKLVLVP